MIHEGEELHQKYTENTEEVILCSKGYEIRGTYYSHRLLVLWQICSWVTFLHFKYKISGQF